MTYFEIHRMHREGYSVSQISKHLVMNRRTVSRYLSMSEQEYEAFLIGQSERRSILEPYEEFVLGKLKQFGDTSSAQMHDWLKERFKDFPVVSARTVFNFVSRVRRKYNLPRMDEPRQCMMVEELPFGLQAQADFGLYNMRDTSGKRIRVSFIALILSRSRYKFVWFIEGSFTTALAIRGHELAFGYFHGLPKEMVYDQDRVFMVDENKGDLILTAAFRAYSRERGFNLHFCRKADPQSKGKVENLVKYIKQNFLYNRTFHNLETLNDEALGWLGRTANALPHAFTRKEPDSVWRQEQPFLQPYIPRPATPPPLLEMAVRKDNTVSYKGNYYSLPLGTYKGRGTWVNGRVDNDHLLITAKVKKGEKEIPEELCRHLLEKGRGQKVINTDHKRDKTSTIHQMIEQLSPLLKNPAQGKEWLWAIRTAKPRYIRDQLLLIRKAIEETEDKMVVSNAVDYCRTNHITSAADFKSVLSFYRQEEGKKKTQPVKMTTLNPLSGKMPDAALSCPKKSAIQDYETIINHKKALSKKAE